PVNHRGPVYLYSYVIFGLAAPWSLLLPAALLNGRTGETRTARTFARVFFWATFAFFTLSASRRSYYLLPILPAAGLLVGRLLATPTAEYSRAVRVLTQLGSVGIAATVGSLGLLLVPASWFASWTDLPPVPARPLVALVGVACAAGVML